MKKRPAGFAALTNKQKESDDDDDTPAAATMKAMKIKKRPAQAGGETDNLSTCISRCNKYLARIKRSMKKSPPEG